MRYSRPVAARKATPGSGSPVTDTTGSSAACPTRSEEHTSELQSQSNLVCRLLLEKKKPERSATCAQPSTPPRPPPAPRCPASTAARPSPVRCTSSAHCSTTQHPTPRTDHVARRPC